MKLVHSDFKHQIIFKENSINYLVIENPMLMYEIYQELFYDCKKLVLSEDNKPINIKKTLEVIRDPVSLEFTQKSVVNALNNIVRLKLHESEYLKRNMELWSMIDKFFIELLEEIDIPIVFDQTENMDALMKIMNIKVNEEHSSLIERLVDYLDILFRLCDIKLVVIFNIRAYLSIEEISKLYEMVFLEKWNVLCLDYMVPIDKIKEEKYYIIDKDLCEIY